MQRRTFNPTVHYSSLYGLNQQTDHWWWDDGVGGVGKHTPLTQTFGDSSPASRNFRKISDDAPMMRASFQHIFLFSGGGGGREGFK